MADSTAVIKFFDVTVRPPRGGWGVTIDGRQFDGYSESDVASEIAKWRRNNVTFQGAAAIESEMWAIYCAREPDRCGSTTGVRMVQGSVPVEMTPERYGPWIWQFLNLAAARWELTTAKRFHDLCDWIVLLLECPICREEWRRLLTEFPPTTIASRLQACTWVNVVHNQVNARKGKALFPYSQMISEYGAPAS